jgi:hypothetical protein
LGYPGQGLEGWRKSLEQISAGGIMLSKAMSSVRYERSHPDRRPGGIAVPSNIWGSQCPAASTKKAIRSIPRLWIFPFVVFQQHFYKHSTFTLTTLYGAEQ